MAYIPLPHLQVSARRRRIHGARDLGNVRIVVKPSHHVHPPRLRRPAHREVRIAQRIALHMLQNHQAQVPLGSRDVAVPKVGSLLPILIRGHEVPQYSVGEKLAPIRRRGQARPLHIQAAAISRFCPPRRICGVILAARASRTLLARGSAAVRVAIGGGGRKYVLRPGRAAVDRNR